MAANPPKDQNILVREAQLADLESLTTILPRSFHPVNEYVKKALPDTPAMRQWWREVYRGEVTNPLCYPMVAVDTDTQSVVGAASLRLIRPDDPSGGLWTQHPWTEDHNVEMWRPPIDIMVEYEKKLRADKAYYLLEIMAVDHAYKGRSLGKRLVVRLCEIADQAGHPIFLQTGTAKEFYLKLGLGFWVDAEPFWAERSAAIMVRSAYGNA